MGLFGPTQGFQDRQALRDQAASDAQNYAQQSAAYRMALQRGTWDTLGPEFSQGLGAINNQLAGAGPLADSGAATALRSRLAGNIYGRAQGMLGQGMADFAANSFGQMNTNRNNLRLLQYQRSMQPGGFGNFLGKGLGALGTAYLGRPSYNYYNYGGGGGGTQANDVYTG